VISIIGERVTGQITIYYLNIWLEWIFKGRRFEVVKKMIELVLSEIY
jgi:hypothetical protein